jgi:hypothetical protein
VRLEGKLPVQIQLILQPFHPPTQASKVPRPIAPSARKSGPNLYPYLSPKIGEYCEAVKPEMGSISRVVVQARMEGAGKVTLVLDSGLSQMLLSPEMARKMGLEPRGTQEVWLLGSQGTVRAEEVVVPMIHLGAVTLVLVPALLVPDRGAVYDEADGALPLGLLSRFGLAFDRRAKTLTLYEPGSSAEAVLGTDFLKAPLRWREGRPFVAVVVDGEGPAQFLLDTSANFSYLSPRALKDWNVPLATVKYGIQHDQGYGGPWDAGVAEDLHLRLGGVPIHLNTVRTGPLPPPNDIPCMGIIGREILDLFIWYLDGQARACYFKKGSPSSK